MEKLEKIAIGISIKGSIPNSEASPCEPNDAISYTGVSLVNRETYNGGTSIMYWM